MPEGINLKLLFRWIAMVPRHFPKISVYSHEQMLLLAFLSEALGTKNRGERRDT